MTEVTDSETEYSIVHRNVVIPTGDATVRATRHEPTTGNGPRPAVLTYTPYHKDDLSNTESDPLVRYFAERGYEVVVADVVGTGASDGLAETPFSPSEGEQGAAVVEWLAERDWTTGTVGVVGKSYPGTTALEIAAERPSGLAAIVPIHAPYRTYASYFDGGALAFLRTCGIWAPNFEFLPAQPPARRDSAGQWADLWNERLDGLGDRDPYLFQYLDHPVKDDYWAAKDVPVERIRTPTLAVGGYRDPFAESTVEYFERIDAPKRLLLGPWRHTSPDAGREAAIDFLGEVERWFDHFLREADTDAMASPPIRFWTERNGGGQPEEGAWRGRDAWPRAVDAEVNCVEFALTDGGLTDPEEFDVDRVASTWDPDYGVGVASIGFEVPGGQPLDTSPDDARSLTYDSDPLSEPVELTGSGEARLTVVPETSDPLVAVRIVDIASNGDAQLVTHGVRRGSLAHTDPDPPGSSAAAPEPLPPNETTTVTVPLRPRSHVFEAGHRIRVAVSGAFFPYVLPPTDVGGFTVASTTDRPSLVRFPGQRHEGSVTFDRPVSFDPPRDEYVPDSPATDWETTYNHADDRVGVVIRQSYSKPLADATFEYSMAVEATVDRDDRGSPRVERTTETKLDYPTEAVVTRVWNSASQNVAHITYDVTVDGESVYSESKRWYRGDRASMSRDEK